MGGASQKMTFELRMEQGEGAGPEPPGKILVVEGMVSTKSQKGGCLVNVGRAGGAVTGLGEPG
jgi:hypothetical protein